MTRNQYKAWPGGNLRTSSRPSARWLRRAPAAPWSNRRAPSAAAGANPSVWYRADLESAGQGSGGPMTSTSYSANTAFIFSALLRSASVIRDSAATHSSIRPAGSTEANKPSGDRAGVLETMGTPARYQDAGAGGYGMAPTIYFKQELPFQDEERFFHVMVDVQRHTKLGRHRTFEHCPCAACVLTRHLYPREPSRRDAVAPAIQSITDHQRREIWWRYRAKSRKNWRDGYIHG